jgi:hypothetical protein
MYTPFNQLPDSARVWIYQADRKLTTTEMNAISGRLRSFMDEWTAHNMPLQASFTIAHDQFIILAADESRASGCSIDESVRTIKEISQEHSIDLLNRGLVTFKIKELSMIIAVGDLQSALQEGKWNRESLVFNLTVKTVGELKHKWIVPAGETWLRRYLDQVIA